MGNRAVITFATYTNAPAIYLHWNGGRASVEGFLSAARQLGLRHARGPRHKPKHWTSSPKCWPASISAAMWE